MRAGDLADARTALPSRRRARPRGARAQSRRGRPRLAMADVPVRAEQERATVCVADELRELRGHPGLARDPRRLGSAIAGHIGDPSGGARIVSVRCSPSSRAHAGRAQWPRGGTRRNWRLAGAVHL